MAESVLRILRFRRLLSSGSVFGIPWKAGLSFEIAHKEVHLFPFAPLATRAVSTAIDPRRTGADRGRCDRVGKTG